MTRLAKYVAESLRRNLTRPDNRRRSIIQLIANGNLWAIASVEAFKTLLICGFMPDSIIPIHIFAVYNLNVAIYISHTTIGRREQVEDGVVVA